MLDREFGTGTCIDFYLDMLIRKRDKYKIDQSAELGMKITPYWTQISSTNNQMCIQIVIRNIAYG